MANARTRFDTIRDYMVRSHSATSGTLYGKPCALLNGHAFLYFHQDWAAFLLKGRVRLQALALPGARFWDPLGREGASMDWVIVPDAHFLRWDRLAIEAVKVAHAHGQGRRPIAGPAEGPPQPPPAAKRWINSIKSLFAKAAELTLSKQEAVPEKTISPLFAETAADLEARDVDEIAALAEPAAETESPGGASATAAPVEGRASFAVEQAVTKAEVPQGRASFVVDQDTATPPAPTGRASFVIDESDHSAAPAAAPAAATKATSESASPTEQQPPTPAYSGRASFQIAADDHPAQSPPATKDAKLATTADANQPAVPSATGGRASFQLAEDDGPQPTTPATPKPAPASTPLAAPTDAGMSLQDLQPEAAASVSGRASFKLADEAASSAAEPPPAQVKPPPVEEQGGLTLEEDQQQTAATGRASFQIDVGDPKPAAGSAGRASFNAGSDPAAKPAKPAPTATPTPAATPDQPEPAKADAWAEKIAKYQLEATGDEDDSGKPITGRAVFAAREPDPLPGAEPRFKIKEPEKPMGRASFKIADDDAEAQADEPDGLDFDSDKGNE